MDGCYCNSSTHLTTDPTNSKFNDSGSNYVDQGQAYSVSRMTKIIGTSEAGFISGSSTSGSDTTYYADSCFVYASACVFVGGSWNNPGNAGVFYFCANGAASNSYSFLGCRICYL